MGCNHFVLDAFLEVFYFLHNQRNHQCLSTVPGDSIDYSQPTISIVSIIADKPTLVRFTHAAYSSEAGIGVLTHAYCRPQRGNSVPSQAL